MMCDQTKTLHECINGCGHAADVQLAVRRVPGRGMIRKCVDSLLIMRYGAFKTSVETYVRRFQTHSSFASIAVKAFASLVLGIGLCAVGMTYYPAFRALSAIRAAGGQVLTDRAGRGGRCWPHEVTEVCFSTQDVNSTSLSPIADLPMVRSISMDDCVIDATSARPIGHVRSLETLVIRDCKVSDGSLREVPRLSRLTLVSLFGSDVATGDIAAVAASGSIRTLNLRTCVLDDRQCELIAANSSVKVLLLGRAELSEHAIALFSRMRQLTEIDLSRTSVTDWGLRGLERLGDLTRIDVRQTGVSAEAIVDLSRAARRAKLYVTRNPKWSPAEERDISQCTNVVVGDE